MSSKQQQHSKPKIFIGSAVEGLKIAQALKQNLHFTFDCFLWPEFFEAGAFNIEGLEKALDQCSYAIIVMAGTDKTSIRGEEHATPRANLIFELGMFAGRYGKKSVFMVSAQGEDVLLPNDLLGIEPERYEEKILPDQGVHYDVDVAASRIAEAIEKHQRSIQARPARARSSFWEGLADEVLIVYGVEDSVETDTKLHPRVSLRDLNTAHLISGFLNRSYSDSDRMIFPVYAQTPGWKQELRQRAADLIFVGGFVTNAEYGWLHLRSPFERESHFRLKMGRICGIEGRGNEHQRVFHPEFDGSSKPPPRTDPQAIENYPSRHMRRDFGRIFSSRLDIFGGVRRVVTIAGIKGHGTQGAATALIRVLNQSCQLDDILPKDLTGNETIEIIVATDVYDNTVARAEVVEVVLNGAQLFVHKETFWESCELGTPCQGCTWGIPERYGQGAIRSASPSLKAFIFDLDDTLVDTFNCLIRPLERAAAEKMVEVVTGHPNSKLAEEVTHLLMDLRTNSPHKMSSPEQMKELLGERLPQFANEKALGVWSDVYSKLSLHKLKSVNARLEEYQIDPKLRQMLRDLKRSYAICLLTSGPPAFQWEKIRYLGLDRVFDETEIIVLDSSGKETKEGLMDSLLKKQNYNPESVVVVGNRLDHEIKAAHNLAMIAVRVNHGEGSGMKPDQETGKPHRSISSLARLPIELPDFIASLETSRAVQGRG